MAKKIVFSARRFLTEQFGPNPDVMILDLQKHGEHRPDRDTARKWYERDSMPGDWLAVIVYALELRDGKPPALGPYINVNPLS